MLIKVKEEREQFKTSRIFLKSKKTKKTELVTIYKTKDLGEASALVASQCSLLNLKPEQGFFWFVFDNVDSCRKLSDSYWNRELTVSAKNLVDAMRFLKERIFKAKFKEEE